jgi:hypothetical protein
MSGVLLSLAFGRLRVHGLSCRSPQQALIGALGSQCRGLCPFRKGDGETAVHQMTPTGENRILQSLSPNDLSLLRPQLKKINLERGVVLHQPNAPMEYIYFPTSGMVSILAIMQTGDAIETAVVGREGVVGGSIGSEGSLSCGQSTSRSMGACTANINWRGST